MGSKAPRATEFTPLVDALPSPAQRLRAAIAKLTGVRRDFEMIELEQQLAKAGEHLQTQRLRLVIRRIMQVEDYLA
jgi:hypothetical protein